MDTEEHTEERRTTASQRPADSYLSAVLVRLDDDRPDHGTVFNEVILLGDFPPNCRDDHLFHGPRFVASDDRPLPGRPPAALDSWILLCGVVAEADTVAITTAVAICQSPLTMWFGDSGVFDEDVALVIDVQSYLRNRSEHPPSPYSRQAWNTFYGRFQVVVKRIAATFSRRAISLADREDVSQAVWEEIVAKLPDLAYSPARGGLSAWVTVLAWRRARRLTYSEVRLCHTIECINDAVPSLAPGPEQLCCLREIRDQLEAALAKLGERTSARSYEVFYRRVFGGESVGQIAASLELTPDNVRQLHCRTMQKWRRLAKDVALPGLGEVER